MVPSETIRALQVALAATTTESDEDPDYYTMQAKRLRNRLPAVKKPVTERCFMGTVVQGLPEKCRDIKLTIYKDPGFGQLKIQDTMRQLYLDDLLHNNGKSGRIAGRRTAMLADPSHGPNIVPNHPFRGQPQPGLSAIAHETTPPDHHPGLLGQSCNGPLEHRINAGWSRRRSMESLQASSLGIAGKLPSGIATALVVCDCRSFRSRRISNVGSPERCVRDRATV